MADDISIRYAASKTLGAFHASDKFVRGVMGPIGSGKSVGCCAEIIWRAMRQEPDEDGIRRSRWAAIRNTYPELKTTTLRTWMDWYGHATTLRMDQPITATVRFGDVELELIFLSVDRPEHIKKLLSLDLTGVWINEAREIRKTTLDAAGGRVGRYPSMINGPGPTWSGVIMDTNPPGDDHWWYKLAEEDRPEGYQFFRQPSALLKVRTGVYIPNPAAENVKHHKLGYDYWMRQLPGKREEWIKVYILGQYGTVLDGKAVYPEYRDEYHCAGDILEPLRGVGLILGWDYGRTPSCIVGQMTARGQLRCIDEFVVDATGEGMGIRTFTRDIVKPALSAKYNGMTVLQSWGDPSGIARDGNDLSMFDIQAQEGIPTEPAPTNDPISRQDAVIKFLKTSIDGEPGFLLSPKCVFIRKGFLGGYQYAKMNVSGDDRYAPAPAKNKFSHPHDALQHMCQAASGGITVAINSQKREVKVKPSTGWT